MDVLYEGYLEKCFNPDEAKREWRRRYFVLRKALGSGTQTLEYFKDKEWRKQEPKGVLTLFSGYTACKLHDTKKKFTFEVKTIDNFFILSAANEEAREKWIEVLQQTSSVRTFAVSVEETPKSVELGFKNKEPCKLQITMSTVILMLESNVPISWPFNCIRRYKCHPGSFLIEVGRKASTGEGVFCFFTQEGQDIFDILGKTVSNRMTAKQEQPKSDCANVSAAFFNNANESQGYPLPSGISGMQTPSLDFTGGIGGIGGIGSVGVGVGGGGEGVRFVMKRRTSSTPQATQSESPRSPPFENGNGSYSHLKLQNDKSSAGDESTDYDQLARAKACSRFNRTRLSESNKPSSSSNKALKVLGLLRSTSSENVPSTEGSSAESCDLYSHLEFDKRNLKKSQSASNIFDNESSSSWQVKNGKNSESSQNLQGDVYNQLNSDLRKKIDGIQRDNNAYDVIKGAHDASTSPGDTYDKLNTRNVPGTHRHARPEPIIMTDDSYNPVNFAIEGGDEGSNSKPSRPHVNAYEISAPLQRTFSENLSQSSEDNSGMPENRPSMGKPAPRTGAKPMVAKKPAPSKPPRQAMVGVPPKNGGNLPENGRDSSLGRAKVGGNDLRESLVSQLKKNFEICDQESARLPSSPFSPPNSAKKLVEPFYAVSPFASGNQPTQVVPNEYDVPSNNVPKPEQTASESRQPIDFLYAVSPFHSGNHKELQNPDTNLYDTPRIQNQQPVASDALNTYDVPVKQPVAKPLENLYDTPSQQPMHRMPLGGTNEHSPASDRGVNFTYAVSPFAGVQNNSEPIRFHENGNSNKPQEPTYCEVPEGIGGYQSFGGYDPVGGILRPGRPTKEPLYADPRD